LGHSKESPYFVQPKKSPLNQAENIFLTQKGSTYRFFVAPSLEAKSAGICDLYVLLEKSSIQLTLKERRSGDLLALEILPSTGNKNLGWKVLLENASANSKLLRDYEFLKVMIGITSKEFTFVPEALFKVGDENVFFKSNFSLPADSSIRSRLIQPLHMYIVFSVSNELEKELNHLFEDPQLWHYSQALLTGINRQLKTYSGKNVWLNIRPGSIDIVVSENKKLLMMNSFNWQVNEDILYHTLFVVEQLELNPEKLLLTVTGEIEEDSALHSLLNKYIRDIHIPESPQSLSFAVAENNLPFHPYALLYNLALCE
jgi:hypothetical protein